MLIRFPKRLLDNTVFDNLQTKYKFSIIQYIINSKYRTKEKLQGWLKAQVQNPSIKLQEVAQSIEFGNSYDECMMNILSYVRNNLKYTPDSTVWKSEEYWATANEIVEGMKDDCDGGATLIYVLARLKGVPANRLLIFAGDVEGGGHAWLGYKPEEYPLNWTFLDWCYWVNLRSIKDRPKFEIQKKRIIEYKNDLETKDSNYKSIWFGVNEDFGYTELVYSSK